MPRIFARNGPYNIVFQDEEQNPTAATIDVLDRAFQSAMGANQRRQGAQELADRRDQRAMRWKRERAQAEDEHRQAMLADRQRRTDMEAERLAARLREGAGGAGAPAGPTDDQVDAAMGILDAAADERESGIEPTIPQGLIDQAERTLEQTLGQNAAGPAALLRDYLEGNTAGVDRRIREGRERGRWPGTTVPMRQEAADAAPLAAAATPPPQPSMGGEAGGAEDAVAAIQAGMPEVAPRTGAGEVLGDLAAVGPLTPAEEGYMAPSQDEAGAALASQLLQSIPEGFDPNRFFDRGDYERELAAAPPSLPHGISGTEVPALRASLSEQDRALWDRAAALAQNGDTKLWQRMVQRARDQVLGNMSDEERRRWEIAARQGQTEVLARLAAEGR